MLRALTLSILFFAVSSQAATPCELLVESLKQDPNVHFTKVLNAYRCGPNYTAKGGKVQPVQGCLIRYESAWNKEISPKFAYLDATNKLKVNWMIISSDYVGGWEGSGKYLCADVKTYARVTGNASNPVVSASRETARDMLFCPFRKTYADYEVGCQPL